MWLALETATDRASVAIGEGAEDAVEESLSGARRHAGALLPMIEAVLRRRGATLDQVSGVVVSDGPGSFTGLRVGASVGKALARARGLPLWTAPSLVVRAAGVAGVGPRLILAVSDALRGEVYAAAVQFEAGRVRTVLAAGRVAAGGAGGVGPRPRGAGRRSATGRGRGARAVDRASDDRSSGRGTSCRKAHRPYRARGRRATGGRCPGMGAGLRSAGRGASAVGDCSWTPHSGFGRRLSLTSRRSSRSSAAASAIRGASPAFARRSSPSGPSAWWRRRARGLAGYLIGREAAGSGEVLNLAVAPEFRRRGVGGMLLESGLAAFRRRRATEVFLEVRESNQSAKSLYMARGFRPVGQRASYYRNPQGGRPGATPSVTPACVRRALAAELRLARRRRNCILSGSATTGPSSASWRCM